MCYLGIKYSFEMGLWKLKVDSMFLLKIGNFHDFLKFLLFLEILEKQPKIFKILKHFL